MNQTVKRLLQGTALLILAVAGAAFGMLASRYVQKETAKVRKEPKSRAAVAFTLSGGDEIEILADKGRYYKIKFDGKTGYIYKKYTGEEPPQEEKLDEDILAQKTSNSTVRTHGTKGLSEVGKAFSQKKQITSQTVSDVTYLETFQLDNKKITLKDVERFMQEGGLGEYAKGGQ